MAEKDLGKSSTGMQPNVAALLSYLFGWITGLIFFLVEKENKFVRFHALQSLIVFATLNIIVMIPVIGWVLAPIVGVLGLVLWIILMIKAYHGEKFKLPVAGDIAEKKA
ncbi:MAG: DUF4870 domain-containing protein [Candidatus Omnitrophota bacterium]|nr:MAG: DUF4870 domain-containing protein [Candidatus Omnitrophota bacterium]